MLALVILALVVPVVLAQLVAWTALRILLLLIRHLL